MSSSHKNTISFVFNVNLPFVREAEPHFVIDELPFFETLSLSFIPFLQMLDRLEAARVPFHIALVMPPVVCHMLNDEFLINRYLEYVDNQISFGRKEIKRCKDTEVGSLAQFYYENALKKRNLFIKKYNKDICGALTYYAQRGKLEIVTSAAVNAFLPFYINYPASIAAQVETALISHRKFFKSRPQGFWLPELAYCPNLDKILRTYKLGWTLIDTHAALLSKPCPETGSFYPVKTQSGLFMLVKDFYAYRDIMNKKVGLTYNKIYCSYERDAGYELPADYVMNFISGDGVRLATGYRYYTSGRKIYNAEEAEASAKEAAHKFLANRIAQLNSAGNLINKNAISVCHLPFDFFGRRWSEGWTFIEEIFRCALNNDEIQFLTPQEYIYKEQSQEFPVIEPEYSSSGYKGYAENFMDSSNTWVYRHIMRSIERMEEIAERFSGENDIKERVLNQAAREVILATDTRWVRRNANANASSSDIIVAHLRNFTTLYESLGNSRISPRFLAELELKNNVFPEINYRSFKRKKRIGPA
jgi:1,4-alpha-glucan branching enzyme